MATTQDIVRLITAASHALELLQEIERGRHAGAALPDEQECKNAIRRLAIALDAIAR